jgi:mRNA-degrading endonuclease RelE of RelBE toxin-antitoxin system
LGKQWRRGAVVDVDVTDLAVPGATAFSSALGAVYRGSSANRTLARLPEKAVVTIVEFLLGPLTENPKRIGHPLRRELGGFWSARGGAYRVVYEVDEAFSRVQVLHIDHRADVYRPDDF